MSISDFQSQFKTFFSCVLIYQQCVWNPSIDTQAIYLQITLNQLAAKKCCTSQCVMSYLGKHVNQNFLPFLHICCLLPPHWDGCRGPGRKKETFKTTIRTQYGQCYPEGFMQFPGSTDLGAWTCSQRVS